MQPPYGYGSGQQYQPYTPPPPAYSRMLTMGLLGVGAFALSLGAQWIVHLIDVIEWDAIEMRSLPSWVAPTERLFTLTSSLIRLVGIPLFLIWVHGVASNTRALGRTSMTITPGWAVGWFFIPVASIYMPYKAISEIASCSDPRGTAITPPIVTVWWAAFIAGNLVRVLGSSLLHVIGVSAYIEMEIIATVLLTGAAAALFRVILTIHRGQEEILRASFPR